MHSFILICFCLYNSSGFLEVNISWFFDFDQSNNLAHLTGVFRLFMYNMITDMIEFKFTNLTVCLLFVPVVLCYFFPLYFSSFKLFLCYLGLNFTTIIDLLTLLHFNVERFILCFFNLL